MMQNPILRSMKPEISSNTGLEGKPNKFSSTIRAFYERTRDERKRLREDPFAVNDEEKIAMGDMTKVGTEFIENNKILHKILKYNRKLPREDKLEAKSSETDDNSQGGGFDDQTYKNSISPKYIREIKNIDVISRGISLKGLRTILEEYQKNKTSFDKVKITKKVIGDKIKCNGEYLTHMLVKPETKHSESYVELFYKVFLAESNNCTTKHEVVTLEKDFDETLGAVNVFVSHSWQYDFKELVDSIEQWEKKLGEDK